MATYHAVAAVGRAIVGLLEGASRPKELATARFALFRTEDFEQPMESGISVYLYRVAPVRMSRTPPSQVGPDGRRRVPPLPLSLHYLFTPWAVDAAAQHRLLAWAMRVLEDTPLLSSEVLNQSSPGTFSASETIELTLEDLTAAEAVDLYGGLTKRHRLGVSYLGRVVMSDSMAGTGRPVSRKGKTGTQS